VPLCKSIIYETCSSYLSHIFTFILIDLLQEYHIQRNAPSYTPTDRSYRFVLCNYLITARCLIIIKELCFITLQKNINCVAKKLHIFLSQCDVSDDKLQLTISVFVTLILCVLLWLLYCFVLRDAIVQVKCLMSLKIKCQSFILTKKGITDNTTDTRRASFWTMMLPYHKTSDLFDMCKYVPFILTRHTLIGI